MKNRCNTGGGNRLEATSIIWELHSSPTLCKGWITERLLLGYSLALEFPVKK